MLLAAELGRTLKGTAKKLPSKPSHGHEGMWTAQARPRMGEATKGVVNFTPCRTDATVPRKARRLNGRLAHRDMMACVFARI